MNITPYHLEAAYEFMRISEPFAEMKLPHADAVEFRVIKSKRFYGWHMRNEQGTNIIALSSQNVTHTNTIMMFMAHEMIHLAQAEKNSTTKAMHNKEFYEIARKVCDLHGFDFGVFC